MNGYLASNSWYRFASENLKLIKPVHAAVIHWCYALCNEKGWPDEFQLPTVEACEMTGITDRETFHKALKDLVSFGAISIIQDSTGRYVARWVSFKNLSFYHPNLSEGKQEGTTEGTTIGYSEGTTEGTTTNIKLKETKETNKTINIDFVIFWDLYGKKDDRVKSEKKWNSLTDQERQLAIEDIPKYIKSLRDRQYQKNPLTYLNGKCWQDEREEIYKANNINGYNPELHPNSPLQRKIIV